MKLSKVENSNDGKTKFTATFVNDDGKIKTVKFGIKGSNTYVDNAPIEVRDAYRARHARDIVNPDPTTKGNLSYWITWGDSKSLMQNIRAYKQKFNV
jgi:hypothetical protein